MIFTTLLTRKVTKSWLSPGVFFAISWTFFLIVPLLFATEYEVDHLGLWFITIFTMACSAGTIIGYDESLNIRTVNYISINSLDYKFLFRFFLFFSTVGLFGLYLLFSYVLSNYNFGFYSMSLLSIPNLISVDRYSGDLNYPIIVKYSLYCIYPANLLGGLLFSQSGKSLMMRLLILSPLLLTFILGILEGARSGILLGLIIYFSAWLSTLKTKNLVNNKYFYLRIIFSGAIFILGFTLFFILVQWLRQGMDSIIIELLFNRIKAYFFGYLAAFSLWLSELENTSISGGLTTFAGPFNLIGIIDRPLGFYSPINISPYISTNIFTVFRGLIKDFSIPGAICIGFIIGFVSQLIFQKKSYGNIILTLPISMFYAFTLYSPLISIFHYNSISFSWIIVFLIVLLNKNEYQNNYS